MNKDGTFDEFIIKRIIAENCSLRNTEESQYQEIEHLKKQLEQAYKMIEYLKEILKGGSGE